jgi:hypothetical protein
MLTFASSPMCSLEASMNDNQITHAFDEIERALFREDPAFVQRLHRVQRREKTIDLSIFVSLAVGAVLLTVGLATPSWPTLAAASIAFIISAALDAHHKRSLKLAPADGPTAERRARWRLRHGRSTT